MSRAGASVEVLAGMGLFDLPAPVLAWLDAQAAALLPATLRLVLWGVIGAVISMGIYGLISPQRRIAQGKRQMVEARARLDRFDGDFADAMPLIRGVFGTSLRQVGRVAGPAVVASLPLLSLLMWLSTAYGYSYPPPDRPPDIHTVPERFSAQWMPSPPEERDLGTPRVLITDERAGLVADIPLGAPVPVLHKRQWWNALFGNPAGYLPASGMVERIRLELPQQRFLGVGPDWVQGWAFMFFVSLLGASVALKVAVGIE